MLFYFTNYGLCYHDHTNIIKFGFTSKFVQIDNVIYAFVVKADKKRSFINDAALESQLGKFFLIGQLNNQIELLLSVIGSDEATNCR